jgi:RHS repeat-associated protein
VRQVTRTVQVQSFDANGENPTERDATTTEVYDRQGRLYQVTEPSGVAGANVTTTYTYDVGNRLTSISTVSQGTTQTRSFSYDNRGFLRFEDLPEKTIPTGQIHDVTYLSYDAARHVRRVVDGSNDLTMTYDRAGRLTNVAVTGGSSLQDLSYSTANSTGSFSNGKLLTATRHNWIDDTDNQVVQTYVYGGKGGRVSQRSTSVEGRTIVQSFTWNDLGQLATIGYPDDTGLAVDPVRTISPTYTKGWLTAVPGFASALSYAVNGMPATITLANGVSVSQGVDPSNLPRIASIATSGASSSWGTGAYAFDGSGNIKSIGSGATKQEFVYDKVSRLVSGQALAGTTLKTQSVAYDAFGNITTTTTTDWGPQTFSVDTATNRLNAPVTYDATGNMTAWGGHTYAFDSLGQLQRVTGTGISHTFLYTADGERIANRDATRNATTLTVRDLGGKVLRSWVKSGTAVAWVKDYVYAGGSLLASVAADPGEGTRYYALDHLGTPRVVTNACKTVVAQHAYYPFGMEATSSSQDTEPMKFTGHERDLMGTPAQTDDLDNMHARSYNPNILRLISVDPLRGNPHSPQSFNLFAYVIGNPVNFTDPLGLKGLPCAPGNARGDDCDETPTPLVPPTIEEEPVARFKEEISVGGASIKTLIEQLKGGTSPVPTVGGQQAGGQEAGPEPQKRQDPSRPCGGFGRVDPGRPDFVAGGLSLGVSAGVSLGLSIDRYGRAYFSLGLQYGKAPTGISGSLTAGSLNQLQAPTSGQLSSYLGGWNATGMAGYGGGLAEGWSPSLGWSGFSTQAGAVSPQLGVSGTYSWDLGCVSEGW